MADPYLTTVQNAPVGTMTEDGNGHGLGKLADNRWGYTEPSENERGHTDSILDDVQAADVLRNVFPGSFNSPEGF